MVPWTASIENDSAVHSAADTPRNNAARMPTHDSAVSRSTIVSLPPADPLHLTFGIEFEFIVFFDPITYYPRSSPEKIKEGCPQRDHPNALQVHCDKAVKTHMVEVLRTAGLEVNNLNQMPLDYSKWTVDDDDSIDCPDLSDSSDNQHRGRWIASIELKTLKMAYFFPSMEAVIQTLDVLWRNFTCATNQSCGLHVHVGNAGPDGHSQGFPLKTLKSLATLASVFNRQFNSLHPYHRIANIHCRSPAQNFPDTDPWEIASTIDSALTTDELIDMMSSDENGDERGFAINFRSLLPESGLRTLEFRQHEATLNPKVVGIWLTLVCGLLSVCHRLTPAQLASLVRSYAGKEKEEFGITHLLAALGMGDFAAFYARRGIYRHPRMWWEWWDEGETEG